MKKTIAFLMSVVMVLSLMPFNVIALEATDTAATQTVEAGNNLTVSDQVLPGDPTIHADHCVCGGKISTTAAEHHNCSNVGGWTALNAATLETMTEAASTGLAFKDEVVSVYLTENLSLTKIMWVKPGQTVNICLNGYQWKSSARVFCTNGTLNVCDCRNTGTVYTTNTGTSPLLYTYHLSNVNIYGGTWSAKANTGKKAYGGLMTFGSFDKGLLTADLTDDDKLIGSTISIYGGTIDASNINVTCETAGGGAITIFHKTTVFNMYDGTILGGKASSVVSNDNTDNVSVTTGCGGAIYMDFYTTFNMYGGTISGGQALTGTGYKADGSKKVNGGYGGNISSKGNFNMYGGTIKNGSAGDGGGNVFVFNGTMTMTGGTIVDGTAYSGGNVYVNQNTNGAGVFTFVNGFIKDGECGECGGNVAVFGYMTMTGGEISNGASSGEGGNISLFQNNSARKATLQITGGTIRDGVSSCVTADRGAANIRIGKNSYLTIDGGEVLGGVTGSTGPRGGILLSTTENSHLILNSGTVSNDISIVGSVYLATGRTIESDAFNFKNGDKVGITMATPGAFMDDPNGQYADYFYSDDPHYEVKLEEGQLKLVEVSEAVAEHTSHCVCGGAAKANHTCENSTWTALDFANAAASAKVTSRCHFEGDVVNLYIPETTGYFNWTKTIDIYGGQTVNVCLNGQSVKTAVRLFNVYDGTLNFCDCENNGRKGTVVSRVSSGGGFLYTNSDGKSTAQTQRSVINIYGGKFIATSSTSRYFGPIVLGGYSDLTSFGGSVLSYQKGCITKNPSNNANGDGGVMIAYGSANTFTINDGYFKGCDVVGYGGAFSLSGCDFTMNGGTVVGAKAVVGGAILFNEGSCSFTMNGGTIKNGVASSFGGCIGVFHSGKTGKFVINGGTIEGGTAPLGGNIGITCNTHGAEALVINGGTITGGKADEKGGNIYVSATWDGDLQNKYWGPSLTVSNAAITDGEAGVYGGNIFAINGKSLTLNNVTVTGGKATEMGGNVFVYGTDRTPYQTGGSVPYKPVVAMSGTFTGGSAKYGADVMMAGCDATLTGKVVANDFYLDAGQTLKLNSFDGTSSVNLEMCVSGGVVVEGGKNYASAFPGTAVTGEDLTMGTLPTATTVTEFSAGFARIDATPAEAVPLDGMGGDYTRQANWVEPSGEDRLTASLIVVADGEDWNNTVVICAIDTLFIHEGFAYRAGNAIANAIGIPYDNVIFNASHTHSSTSMDEPDASVLNYLNALYKDLAEAAKSAVADLKPATVETGSVVTEGLTFLRRYMMSDGTAHSSVYGVSASKGVDASVTPTGYESEMDKNLRAIKFIRDGKDILLTNFQVHPTFVASATEGKITADLVGSFRKVTEASADFDGYCVFFQGAGGNQSLASSLTSEQDPEVAIREKTRDGYAKKLSDYALNINYESAKTGTIYVTHYSLHAQEKKYNNLDPITTYSDLPLNTVTFGDIAFATAPCELFAKNGLDLRERSDFKMTFLLSLSNGHFLYIPEQAAMDHMYADAAKGLETFDMKFTFEPRTSRFVTGTAEAIIDNLVTMLNADHGEGDDVLMGDMNGDGFLNSDDAIYLLKAVFDEVNYPISKGQNADCNGDKAFNSDDAIYLLKHVFDNENYPLSK